MQQRLDGFVQFLTPKQEGVWLCGVLLGVIVPLQCQGYKSLSATAHPTVFHICLFGQQQQTVCSLEGWFGCLIKLYCCVAGWLCAGDAGDMLMIGVSMVVFIWLAMQMYRMYYYVYLQLGVMDMMQ
jgi:hypothetical protein